MPLCFMAFLVVGGQVSATKQGAYTSTPFQHTCYGEEKDSTKRKVGKELLTLECLVVVTQKGY